MEINNHETFDRIVEILNSNNDLFDLEFSFVGTGIAKIHKLSDQKLNINKKLKSRKLSVKNFLEKLLNLSKIEIKTNECIVKFTVVLLK